MRNRWIDLVFVMPIVLAFSPVIFAQTTGQSGAAQTQIVGSVPDLSGVWESITKPGKTFNPKVEPSLLPWAEAKWKANMAPGYLVRGASVDGRSTGGRVDLDPASMFGGCFPTGMPRLLVETSPFEIVQIPGRVIILFERDYAVSHIWTDGRRLPEDPDPTYMGNSVGKWEGDTLVVDTIGLNDKTWVDPPGHPQAIYEYHHDWHLQEFFSCQDRLAHGGEALEAKGREGRGY